MHHLHPKRFTFRRGQTALEYMMMIMLIILPLALAVQELMHDSGDNTKDNLMRRLVTDSHGDEDHFGVIGRPYP